MSAMEIEEVVIFDDGFRIFFFLEECLSPFHDDIGVVVFFDRIAQENLFVGAAQRFLRALWGLGRAGTGREDEEYRRAKAEGYRNS